MPLGLPIRFWLANLGQLQGPIGEFLVFLKSASADLGLSHSQAGQLLLDGVLLLQEIVLLLPRLRE